VDELDGDLGRERDLTASLQQQNDGSIAVYKSEVQSLQKERSALQSRCQTLNMQLTEVDSFLPTNRGKAFQDLENDLAMSKLRNAELEQDKDELLEHLSVAKRRASRENMMSAGNGGQSGKGRRY
jgi:hypothetical protein